MKISPVRRLRGTVQVPGDKSISHRYAILGGTARGLTTIRNYSASQDCQSTLSCLRMLGMEVVQSGDEVRIRSSGWEGLEKPGTMLDAGNSGTTIRILSGLLASRPIVSTIGGDESLNQRPMRRIIDPLTAMGARIEGRDQQFPPLTIRGALRLQAIRYELPVASAQVKSCVLLAGLTAEGQTMVIERVQSRDHTERALPHFGAELTRDGLESRVTGGRPLVGTEVQIPGDFSSAVFFLAAALLVPGSEVQLSGVGLNPTRTGFLSLLSGAGFHPSFERTGESNGEPFSDLIARYDEAVLESFPAEIRGDWIPNLIDEIPILAILGTRLARGLTVRDAIELRRKESDRISSVVTNLRALGVTVEELEDGFHLPPGQRIRGGAVRTFGDHRIAMAFAVAGLISDEGVVIDDPGCASVSYPDFFSDLAEICER